MSPLIVTGYNQLEMMSVINRNGPRSLHKQLKDVLCEDIRRGKYHPGQAIPSERVLCETWGVSRTTVRLAVGEAVAEGVLYRVHGKGTFVAEPRVDQGLFRITSFEKTIRQLGLVPCIQVLRAERVPFDLAIGEILRLPHAEGLFCLELLGLASGCPMALYRSHLSPVLGTLVASRAYQLAGRSEPFSTYELYAPEVGLRVIARQSFEAILATRELATVIDLKPGAPILKVTSAISDPSGHPVEFRQAFYRGDQYRFHVQREHVMESLSKILAADSSTTNGQLQLGDDLGAREEVPRPPV